MSPIVLPYEDQAGIDIAITGYNEGLDMRNLEQYLDAFSPDGTIVMEGGTYSAGDFFSHYWEAPSMEAVRYGAHFYGHGIVTSLEADRMERWAAILFLPHPQRAAQAGFSIRALETRDTFVRVEGRWKYLVKDLTQTRLEPPAED